MPLPTPAAKSSHGYTVVPSYLWALGIQSTTQTLFLTYQIYNSTPIVTELYTYLTHIQQLDVRSGAAAGGGRASPPCPMESTGEPNTASPKFCETVRAEVIDCQSSSHPKSLHVISCKEQQISIRAWAMHTRRQATCTRVPVACLCRSRQRHYHASY